MKAGNNKQLLIAVGSLIGMNLLINLLPPPFGLLLIGLFLVHFLWQTYKNTRY